jgi:hypothetical protein
MNYAARKIYLTCDRDTLNEWAAYMRDHIEEVALSLRNEGVRHEMWFSGEDRAGLYVVGVMDTDDQQTSARIAGMSCLEVDRVHREFKTHWDRSKIQELDIASDRAPTFDDCILLFDVEHST